MIFSSELCPNSRRETSTRRLTGQQKAVDVLAVVAERHAILPESKRVLAGADSIERLKVRLGDAAAREVEVDSVCRLGNQTGGLRSAVKAPGYRREGVRIPTLEGRTEGLGAKVGNLLAPVEVEPLDILRAVAEFEMAR